jgi:excisionase family DNA binding protein
MTMTKLLYTSEEAAEQLTIGRTAVYDLIKSGHLSSVKIGRRRRIPAAALNDFVTAISESGGLDVIGAA